MTTIDRIAGLLATVDALDKQAAAYWAFLGRLIEAEPKNPTAAGPFPDEPPPVSNASIKSVETEIGQLNGVVLGTSHAPTHLYQTYEVFGPLFHEKFQGPVPVLGGKSAHSLKHDYEGLRLWLDQTRSYLNYLNGVARQKEA